VCGILEKEDKMIEECCETAGTIMILASSGVPAVDKEIIW
jgi:hypothetical protein